MPEPITAVLAGCGGISNAWLSACQTIPDLKITGLVDIVESAAQKRKSEYHLDGARTGANLDEMLTALRPDAVFDCTIPTAHMPTTLTALEHGCHVLGEKPMAETMEDARKMAAAAQSAGKLYAVIQNRRYQAEIRQVRRLIESGRLGELTTLNCDFYIGAHFGGFRDVMKHVLLLDMAIHTFDAARLISGADPLSVYCQEWNPAGSWFAHGASAVAIFEMSAGIVYTYRGSWCSEGLNTTWECDWRAVGQQGSLQWDGQQQIRASAVSKRGGFFSEWESVELPTLPDGARTGGHGGQIRDFLDCMRSGRTPETIYSDNIKSLAMVHAAIRSAETGQKVQVSAV